MFLSTILAIDHGVHSWFSSVRDDSLVTFFSFITIFGSWWFVVSFVLFVCLLLYWKNYKHLVLPFVCMLLCAEAVTFALKLAVARPRALDALVTETDFSFPSGHAMIAVALYGFLVYLVTCYVMTAWIRRLTIFILVVLVLLIGLSRLYLGVHYLSDILAGYCVGGAVLFLGMRFLILHRERV